MTDTINMLHANMERTLVCCGLDPDWQRLPLELIEGKRPDEKVVFQFMQTVVDIVAGHVCAFKIQKAFFDLWQNGHHLLQEIIAYIQNTYPGIPTIVDCKIGDIDNTMDAYIDNIFGSLLADGIVVNPYMGDAVLRPFVQYPSKAIVILVKTSNTDAGIVQDLQLKSGITLWEQILDYAVNRWNTSKNIVPVISSVSNANLTKIRKIIPDDMPILFAGVGAQGGSFTQLCKLLNTRNSGVFVNSSRNLLYPQRQFQQTWQQAIKYSVINMQQMLNRIRKLDE